MSGRATVASRAVPIPQNLELVSVTLITCNYSCQGSAVLIPQNQESVLSQLQPRFIDRRGCTKTPNSTGLVKNIFFILSYVKSRSEHGLLMYFCPTGPQTQRKTKDCCGEICMGTESPLEGCFLWLRNTSCGRPTQLYTFSFHFLYVVFCFSKVLRPPETNSDLYETR